MTDNYHGLDDGSTVAFFLLVLDIAVVGYIV